MQLRIAVLFAILLGAASGQVWSKPMRGLLVMGHEARSLQPCDDGRTLWVHAGGALRQGIEAEVRRLTTRPYETVYVELDGETRTEPAGEFAADYDGTVEVREVRLVSKEGVESCRRERLMAIAKAGADAAARTYVFVCGEGPAYTVRTGGAGAWIFHPEGTRQLPAVPASTGTRYVDGLFELRIEGEQALFGKAGGPLRSCRNDPRRAVWERAKLDGADFRAVGNEPGWSLEILEGSRLLLIADYGTRRVELPLPEPAVDRDARRTIWDAGEILLEVIGRPCRDTMSGEAFESEVVVYWQGRALRGCGRALH